VIFDLNLFGSVYIDITSLISYVRIGDLGLVAIGSYIHTEFSLGSRLITYIPAANGT
jgi:hypothetical protein